MAGIRPAQPSEAETGASPGKETPHVLLPQGTQRCPAGPPVSILFKGRSDIAASHWPSNELSTEVGSTVSRAGLVGECLTFPDVPVDLVSMIEVVSQG